MTSGNGTSVAGRIVAKLLKSAGRRRRGISVLSGGLALALASACGPGAEAIREELGVARIALSQTPADAQCLDVSAHGARTVTKRFTLKAGASATLEMAGLPLGAVQFSAAAFGEGCDSAVSTEATWVSDVVPAELVKGVIADVTLVMHRNGRASVSVDFCDADRRSDVANCGSCGHVCDAAPSSQPACIDGQCAFLCDANRADCDQQAANGCEDAIDTDASHCGGCGNACAAGLTCVGGECVNTLVPLAAGYADTCAIVNGAAYCWGVNDVGRLGNNSTIDNRGPTPVQGLSSGVTAVAAGLRHTCAIVNGGAMCWGWNLQGQLGSDVSISSPVPVPVAGLASGVTAIAAGTFYTCAVVNAGARCWGANNRGQLGNDSLIDQSVPVSVKGLDAGVTAIAVGGHPSLGSERSCAIVRGGVWCWGANGSGFLGNNSTTDSPVPVPVAGLASGATAIAVGDSHACAVVNGGVRCWGLSNLGAPASDTPAYDVAPVAVPGWTSGVSNVAAGYFVSCAIVGGGVQCLGRNASGELGNGTTTWSTIPVPVQGLSAGVTFVAAHGSAAGSSVCALVNGAVRCWGNNGGGQLGNGTATSSSAPVSVTIPPCGPCLVGQEICDSRFRGPVYCLAGPDGCGYWGPVVIAGCLGNLGGGCEYPSALTPFYCTYDSAGCRHEERCPDGQMCYEGGCRPSPF